MKEPMFNVEQEDFFCSVRDDEFDWYDTLNVFEDEEPDEEDLKKAEKALEIFKEAGCTLKDFKVWECMEFNKKQEKGEFNYLVGKMRLSARIAVLSEQQKQQILNFRVKVGYENLNLYDQIDEFVCSFPFFNEAEKNEKIKKEDYIHNHRFDNEIHLFFLVKMKRRAVEPDYENLGWCEEKIQAFKVWIVRRFEDRLSQGLLLGCISTEEFVNNLPWEEMRGWVSPLDKSAVDLGVLGEYFLNRFESEQNNLVFQFDYEILLEQVCEFGGLRFSHEIDEPFENEDQGVLLVFCDEEGKEFVTWKYLEDCEGVVDFYKIRSFSFLSDISKDERDLYSLL